MATEIVVPTGRRRRGRRGWVTLAVIGVLVCGGIAVLPGTFARFWKTTLPPPATVEVDRGDVARVVTEYGTLESSDDDVVRCRVESFLSLPSGAPSGAVDSRQSPAGRPRSTGAGGRLASAAKRESSVAIMKGPARTAVKVDGGPAPGRSGEKGAVAGSTPGGTATGAGTSVAGASAAGQSSRSTTATIDAPQASPRPVIRSFNYTVLPHVPLRSTLPDQGAVSTLAAQPPTILSILPEGTRVDAGDVVCELDSSAFRDALQVQRLRFVQAKAWVEQAKYVLEANEIALREYAKGILPQDIALLKNYIIICETERTQAERNLAWARGVRAKGFRTESQLGADVAVLEKAAIVSRDAQGMLKRLVKYTGKRIVKARTAKLEAIRADLFSLESSFQLESERLKRIEAMIANCTMRAPREGVVVHANRVNGWGAVEAQIREGVTVYQSQPIFRLLDPGRMCVKAKINEALIARVRPGQPVLIRLEAFPDRAMRGRVAEIMPISTLAKGPFSDVRCYYATVRIESGGFDELRNGLTAELQFLGEARRGVPRVPLEAVRWFGDRPFAAVVSSTAKGADWLWRRIALGVTDTTFAEVVSGLEPGDRVIAHSESLPRGEFDPKDVEPASDLAFTAR